MITSALLALIVASGAGDTTVSGPGPRVDALRVGVDAVEPDTTKPRRKAVRLSEAYGVRLEIHKWASYATLPLFVGEYVVGDQLMKASLRGERTQQGTRFTHALLAGGIAGLFGVNTITGGLNWWETRNQTDGRTWRTVHSALMLLSDAGFAATGMLASGTRNSSDQRKKHKAVAVGSMSIATLSYVMMLKPFRRD